MAVHLKLRAFTEGLKQQGLLRSRIISAPSDNLVSFDSNDYLSLADDPLLAHAYEFGYKHYPSGSRASIMLSGYHPNHQAVEQAFAKLLKVDECVLFSSGYAANLAVMALLGALEIHCIIDKSVHASIYDGLALSKVSYSRFLHNNLSSLSQKLQNSSQNAVVVTEGIFSMGGTKAPLAALSNLVSKNNVPIIVDEAHSFGVLGASGTGSVAAHHLSQTEVPLRIIPLGKAFAAQGAIVAGQREWIEALLQAGRSIIYSTALSPAFSYGLLKTLDVVTQADDRRSHLMQLIHFFQNQRAKSSLSWSDSETPIQHLNLGCPHRALYFAHELKKKGFSCSAIRAPTVAPKYSGLRIVLNYCHTEEHISSLFNELHTLYEHQSC